MASEDIAGLLAAARDKLASGDGDAAVAFALQAARLNCGGDETRIRDALDRAKAHAAKARRRERAIRPDLTVDEAAELAAAHAVRDDMLERPSLVSSDILRDAFNDGSSVVCVRCGDLVKRARWWAHRDMWCPRLDDEQNTVM